MPAAGALHDVRAVAVEIGEQKPSQRRPDHPMHGIRAAQDLAEVLRGISTHHIARHTTVSCRYAVPASQVYCVMRWRARDVTPGQRRPPARSDMRNAPDANPSDGTPTSALCMSRATAAMEGAIRPVLCPGDAKLRWTCSK